MSADHYQLLADAVLALHVAVVAFVVGGLICVIVGNLRGWRWVNRWRFRVIHLAAIAVVAAQSWLGAICPLTLLEMHLREKAASATYSGSFVEYWLQRILYLQAPPWVFILGYSAFGLLAAFCWWYFPPGSIPRKAHEAGTVR